MSYPKDTKRKNGDEKGKKQKGRLVTGGENKLVILVTAGNEGRKFTYAAAIAIIIILVEIKSRKGEDPRPSTEPAGYRGHTPRGPTDVAKTPTSQKRSPEQLVLLLSITLGTCLPVNPPTGNPSALFHQETTSRHLTVTFWSSKGRAGSKGDWHFRAQPSQRPAPIRKMNRQAQRAMGTSLSRRSKRTRPVISSCFPCSFSRKKMRKKHFKK